MSQPKPDTIRIGLMPPLSGLGALHGPEMSWAGQIAQAEVNAAGGILGRPLELILADDGGLPETAVRTAERLLDLGCVAIVGNLPAGTRTAVAMQVAEPREVPYLNCVPYEGSLFGRYFFSFGSVPSQQLDRMLPHMAKVVGPKMYLVGSNQEWQRVSVEIASRILRERGGDVVGEDFLAAGSARIDEVLARIQCSGADVLLPFFEGEDQLQLLSSLARRGLKKHMAIVLCNFDEAMAAMLSPEIREGLYCSSSYVMSVETEASQGYLRALAELEDVEGIWPHGGGILTALGEASYLAIQAFAKAANLAGSLEPERLLPRLEHVQISGPQGSVRMDPVTHHAHLNHYLSRCRFDGSFEIIKHFGVRGPVIPARYDQVALARFGDAGEPLSTPDGSEDPIAVAVAVVRADGRVELANRTLLRLWGFADDYPLGDTQITELWEESAEVAGIIPSLERIPEWSGTLTARRADGSLKRLQVVAEPILGRNGSLEGYSLACVDIRGLGLQDKHASYKILAMADVGVVAVSEEGQIFEANRRTSELFGYRPDELIGMSVHDLVPSQFRRQHVHQLQGFLKGSQLERRMGVRNDVAGLRKDGSVFPAEVSISRFRSGERWTLVATLRDVTDRRIAESELMWRASHDSLTGLPNRTMIHERLTRALQRSKSQGHTVALLFIDLDGFKLINDTHGHATGDDLLKTISRRLLDEIRPGDTVGRLGGDEFVILCDHISSPLAATALAERINLILRDPIELYGHRLFATASIGLAAGHGATHTADDLLRNADAAMYTAKEQGRDGWRFFSDEIHEQARARLDMTNGLRLAIERNELSVRFQPIIRVGNGALEGAEMLLRWTPDGTEVPPAQFIPVAEMTGSIVPIGKWAFRQACSAQASWRRIHGQRAPYVSVNISARQLNDETLAETWKRDLEETGADPSRVLLELTETSLMSDSTANLRLLRQLAEIGLNVAVDDFGTGYSSLAQLLRMPVSTLKIDREFIDGIDKRHDSKAIVSAVSSMARAMRLSVIAEGVENESQLHYLRDIGCDYVQGFLFYRPLSAADFAKVLDEHGASHDMHADTDQLYAVLYVSLASQPMTEADLGRLLERSRAANRAAGITGFLLYLNGSFMQMLEGPRQRVADLIDQIAQDPRHQGMRTVFEGTIEQRRFTDWSMGFRNMDHVEQGYDFQAWQARTLNFLDMSQDARTCLSLITAFAR